jgi:hypothetical protein
VNEVELAVQRTLTHEFILSLPTTITLQPRVKTRQPSGGFIWQDGAPRAPQVMRLCEPSTIQRTAPEPITTGDGVQREIVFMLLGEHDAVMEEGDWFEHGGHRWEIVQVAHPLPWEMRASVARHG